MSAKPLSLNHMVRLNLKPNSSVWLKLSLFAAYDDDGAINYKSRGGGLEVVPKKRMYRLQHLNANIESKWLHFMAH